MANPLDVPNYPGSAQIEYVYHDNGETNTDITLLISRIDIHSDIQAVASRCHIQFLDYENYMQKSLINAGDLVAFQIKENGRSFERRYKISEIKNIINSENSRLYQIILVSELEYASFHVKISKHFLGNASDVAKGILDNYTKEGHNFWEQSKTDVEFIAPMWSPLKTLKWLSTKARSGTSISSFMFFQNSKQFWNFMSLPFLRTQYSQNPITFRYYKNTTSNDGIPDTQKIMTAIQSLYYIDSFDIRDEMQRGVIQNTDYEHDSTIKALQITKNSYFDTYSVNALNELKQWKQEDYGTGKHSISFTHRDNWSQLEYGTPQDEVQENLGYSKGQQIEITIYGNDAIDIGQIVNVEIPSPEPHKPQENNRLDMVWSGLYYVVSKHDAYDRTGHVVALRLAKDSYLK